MEDLLARLEVESDKTAHKIVALLESSYFPSAGDDSTRVQRSVIAIYAPNALLELRITRYCLAAACSPI